MGVREDIEREEGRVPHAYKDSKGIWTCGIGFNIDKDHGGTIPDVVMDFWLTVKLQQVEEALDKHLAWWRSRPDEVQQAMTEMAYQMGVNGLLGFKRTLACLQAGDYEGAVTNALDSDWARKDSPARALRVTGLFLSHLGNLKKENVIG